MNEKNERQAQSENGQVQIFENAQFGQIRTAGTSENPLFCLADICKVLEITVPNTKKRLNEKGVYSIYTLTQGGEQQLLYINEQNLYKVIMRSDKPQAEPFQDWVCGEVLPSIRKSGGYLAAQPDETPEMIMARALKVADETIKRTQQRLQIAESTIEAQKSEIQQLAPLAEYTQEVLQSDTTYTFTQIAKAFNFRSVNTFTAYLLQNKIIYRQSDQYMPTAKYAGQKLFATRTAKYFKKDGSIGTSLSTVITEKGRMYLQQMMERSVAV